MRNNYSIVYNIRLTLRQPLLRLFILESEHGSTFYNVCHMTHVAYEVTMNCEKYKSLYSYFFHSLSVQFQNVMKDIEC